MVRLRLLLLAPAWFALSALAPSPAPSPSPTPAPPILSSPSPSPAPALAPTPTPSPSAAASATPPPERRHRHGLSPATAAPSASPIPLAYALFIHGAKRQSGLIDILQKDDDVFFDLGPEQLGKTFIIAPVIAGGVGGQTFAGLVYPSFLIEFKRVGKRILWISRNTNYAATSSSAQAALDISVADTVLASTPIAAENEATGHVIIPAALFLSDFEDIGHDLGAQPAPIAADTLSLNFGPRPTFTVDASKSYIERVKALPQNVELLVSLAFAGPADATVNAPDPRGVVIKMHYSIVELPPPSAYVPRLADDRVGYAITAQKRFGDDNTPTAFVRYIERWNLAKGPITYYLSNEIPPEYRPVVRRALLTWNTAFAKIGLPNAIV
ncbi:MAG TPA: DUF5117 domain-containing protein, partial [Candidatus Baltobacteraceae bacterium]